MLKVFRLISKCSNSKPPELPPQLKSVFSYYQSGKATVSISQHVVFTEQGNKKLFPNYYIHQQLCTQMQKLYPGFLDKSIADINVQGRTLLNIYRLIVKGHIGNKDLGFNINSLKANIHFKKLTQARQKGKFITKASQIIIDDPIEQKKGGDIETMLKSNILEVEKLIQTGLKLPISFMISKSNVRSQTWLKCLTKKRKAIHSDIIQYFGQSQPQNKTKTTLEQFVYNHGYKLQHIFLRPYSRGCPTGLLSHNDGFNIEQLLKVLSIIDFQGKIILENTQHFYENIQFLDSCLKKCGYQKKRSGDIDIINQYMIF